MTVSGVLGFFAFFTGPSLAPSPEPEEPLSDAGSTWGASPSAASIASATF